MLTQIWCF